MRVAIAQGCQNRIAIGGSHWATQNPRRVGSPCRPIQELDERIPLNTHGADEDGVGLLNPAAHVRSIGDLNIEVAEIELPVLLRHLRGEGDQSQGWKGSFAADVLHNMLEAPEGFGWKRWCDEQPFFLRHIGPGSFEGLSGFRVCE